MADIPFADLMNLEELHALFEELCAVVGVSLVLLDAEGRRLAASHTQRICREFHHAAPEAKVCCDELDASLARRFREAGLEGKRLDMRCGNALRVVAVPISSAESGHLGTLLLGQFLYDDDTVEPAEMASRAHRLGFDPERYAAAMAEAPRFSRERVDAIIRLLSRFARLFATQATDAARLRRQEEESHRAHVELEEQLNLLKALFDALPAAIFLKDLKGFYRQCNAAFLSLLKLPREEVLGARAMDIAPLDLAVTYEAMDAELLKHGGVQRHETTLVDAEGEAHHVLLSKALYRNAQGAPQGYIGAALDISERKRAQQQAAEQQRLYRLLADNVADVITIFDRDYVVQYTSPSVERLLGYTAEEATALPLEQRLPPEALQTLQATLEQSLDEAEGPLFRNVALRCELRQRRKDGSLVWTEMVTTPLVDDAGEVTGWLSVTRDIAPYKRTEQALLEAKEDAEAANIAKSAFLANMSHEIRTPLNGVFGMLQILMATPLNKEQRHYVEVALESGRSLVTLIEDILEFSRLETGDVAFDVAPFSLRAICSTLLDTFRIDAERRDIALTCELAPEIPDHLLGDDARLRQILLHLVGNALKFTHEGWVRIAARVLPPHERPAAQDDNAPDVSIEFSVEDTGIGIPDDKLDAIFQPFAQVDGSFTRQYQGAGLGLGLVKRLVDGMGGVVAMRSVVGKGSTAVFTIPFRLPEPALRPLHAHADRHSVTTKNGRILVAEDDRVNQLTALRFLEKLGYEAQVVENGLHALQALRRQPFDLVVMDVQMPELDGVAATRAIRADTELGERRNVPIIAMTAHAMAGDKERFLDAGMDEYIAKPVDLDTLRDVIKRVLEPNADA